MTDEFTGLSMTDYGTVSDAGRLMVTGEQLVEMYAELKRRAQELGILDLPHYIQQDNSPSLGGQNKDISPMLSKNHKRRE